MNYAASLAQVGLRTLLIDADLRRPCVETDLLGQASDHVGVTDYLLGKKTLQEVARPTKMDNLFFISGGSVATNPAELLARDGLGGLITDALKHYDRVVLDSAPINAVSDTLMMLKNVQAMCLVVKASATSSRYVLRCVQLLQGAEAPLSGIILNQMPRRRGPGYGAFYDYQYHGKYSKSGVYGAK
jgi:capsular exopolysaccharide synthesis family protein